MTIAERLKIILKIKKMSQKSFSKLIGTDESQVSKLLRGKRKPTAREIDAIVLKLDVPYDCLTGKIRLFDDLLKISYTTITGLSIW